MKKKFYPLLVMLCLSSIILFIFINSSVVNDSIFFSYELFIKNIFPSLFPMFIISYILVEIGIPEFLGSIFYKVFNKLFLVNSNASFVFFMSMLTGFPSSAKYIDMLMDKKMIDSYDASKILTFTFFSNPLFIANTVGVMFLDNINLGFIILVSHIIGNVLVGVLFRGYNKSNITEVIDIRKSIKVLVNKINTTNFFSVFLNGIKDAINTMILIFGIIVTFQIIIGILPCNMFFKGIIEMTTGLKLISFYDDLYLKVFLSTFFISFGGFSIHTQVMNILNKKRVRYLPFLLARIIHSIISAIIAINLFYLMDELL